MPNFSDITRDYLDNLVEFLYSISWMYKVLNTQYVRENVILENHHFLSLLNTIDLNELVNLREPQNNHPPDIQKLIENVNHFRIQFDIINTESWKCNNQQKKMSIKKLYEIENMSELINEVCKDEVTTLVDLGSGLGYLDEHLYTKYGYKIIGLEGSEKNQVQAEKRQEKYYAESIGKVKHVCHFITMESGGFIVKQVDEINGSGEIDELVDCGPKSAEIDILNPERSAKPIYGAEIADSSSLLRYSTLPCGKNITSNTETSTQPKPSPELPNFALFGLHPCGDLSIICIKLFLTIPRCKKLIFSPCCYHKMSGTDPNYNAFNYFPLSQAVKELTSKYPENPFLRPFLRLAGQQSPIKFQEMTAAEHFVHGKNMFERGVVEALLMDQETSKRVNNVTFSEGRLKFEDIKFKYQLLDKSSLEPKEWTQEHLDKFNKIRSELPSGEELSENLFCLQTTVQNSCENLVIMDRVFYIYEQMKVLNMELKVKVKKLQNEKLSPRCLVLIVEKS